jgi:hypothetical protein
MKLPDRTQKTVNVVRCKWWHVTRRIHFFRIFLVLEVILPGDRNCNSCHITHNMPESKKSAKWEDAKPPLSSESLEACTVPGSARRGQCICSDHPDREVGDRTDD